MKAVAIKRDLSEQGSLGLQEMGAFRCDHCGEEFLVNHPLGSADIRIAEKQARWLERVLAEEHERDRKHPDRIELPD
jgi:hypothetical protein